MNEEGGADSGSSLDTQQDEPASLTKIVASNDDSIA